MSKKNAIISIIGIVLATTANAQDETGYHCTNSDFEISCSTQRCDVTLDEGFTPMGVTISNSRFEVCAYSGCWLGEPSLFTNDQVSLVAQGNLVWRDTPEEPPSRMNVVIDKEMGIGVFLGESFAQPMQCRPWKCGPDCQSE